MPRRAWPRTLRWRVHVLVAGLLLLLFVIAGVTTSFRLYTTSIGNQVRGELRPAQQAAAAQSKDYIDMESGVRGFLLTREQGFLDPYRSASADVVRQEQRLRELLSSDPESLRMLDAVHAASVTWQQSIAPAFDPAGVGDLEAPAALQISLTDKENFDVVRARTAELQAHIDELTAAGLARSTGASSATTMVTIVCAALALLLGAVSVLVLRRSFDTPLRRLVGQVSRVSDGDLDARVDAGGAQEVAEVGQAVETMRARILSETRRRTEAAEEVARLGEADRIAHELGDTVVKQLFAIGLTLQSAIARYPVARPVLARVPAELDQAINHLRSALYGHVPPAPQSLGIAVQTLLSEIEAEAGAAPELVLTGDLDADLPEATTAEVLAVLTEVLDTLLERGRAEAVQIELMNGGDMIRLRVAGPAPADRRMFDGVSARAGQLRGGGAVGYQDDRVVIDWWVPV